MNSDPDTYYNATEPDSLVLDANHPGINDQTYQQRRNMFFNVARKHRLNNLGLPEISYTEEEHAIWHTVSEQLSQVHEKKACQIYLQGKHELAIDTQQIPQLKQLDAQLREQHQMGLVPAEGLIDVRNFFAYLSQRLMPCTQFLRHGGNPAYTPEPDAVHDVIGHIPPLMDKTYGDIIQLIGQGVREANMQQLQAWQRIYWFTIEFGLIEEDHELKVLGAGLLSSFGEMEYCFSDKVQRIPFDLQKVIQQNYNSNVMQDVLFVLPDLMTLKQSIEELIDPTFRTKAFFDAE